MKVYICSTRWNIDELIEKYSCLKDFGFIVEETKKTCSKLIPDENGELIIQDYEKAITESYIVLDSLEDLTKLYEAVEEDLIFSVASDGTYIIKIYDGYRE